MTVDDFVKITKLKKITNPKGDIYRVLKSSDITFHEFGEAYFTHINPGETKGWKKHNRMILNLVVPIGLVKFHVHCEQNNETKNYVIGENSYFRLTIQPGVWVAFEGLCSRISLILNIASIEHDPEESQNCELESITLGN